MNAAESLARLFHETYERLAPEFGYKTREASAVPWDDVPDNNKALMIAVAAAVLAQRAHTEAEYEPGSCPRCRSRDRGLVLELCDPDSHAWHRRRVPVPPEITEAEYERLFERLRAALVELRWNPRLESVQNHAVAVYTEANEFLRRRVPPEVGLERDENPA